MNTLLARVQSDYIDRVAAERGHIAAIKWNILGIVMGGAFIFICILAMNLLGHLLRASENVMDLFGGIGLFGGFIAARIFVFALPIAAIAHQKGYGAKWAWRIGGFLFGAIALARAAYIAPKQAPQ